MEILSGAASKIRFSKEFVIKGRTKKIDYICGVALDNRNYVFHSDFPISVLENENIIIAGRNIIKDEFKVFAFKNITSNVWGKNGSFGNISIGALVIVICLFIFFSFFFYYGFIEPRYKPILVIVLLCMLYPGIISFTRGIRLLLANNLIIKNVNRNSAHS
ncbi:MAG: hypothetical protein ABSG94_02100 [Brevinematales bacterium]|jgi:hypothetical protein